MTQLSADASHSLIIFPVFFSLSPPLSSQEGYYLRPEMAESIYYLYRATKDPLWLILGEEMVESLVKVCGRGATQGRGAWRSLPSSQTRVAPHSYPMAAHIVRVPRQVTRTSCGHAVVKDVHTHELGDSMESFFLSETTKYLYLLFADDSHPLHQGSYVFNTEAHPFPVWAARQNKSPLNAERFSRQNHTHAVPQPRPRLLCPRTSFAAHMVTNGQALSPAEPVPGVQAPPLVPLSSASSVARDACAGDKASITQLVRQWAARWWWWCCCCATSSFEAMASPVTPPTLFSFLVGT